MSYDYDYLRARIVLDDVYGVCGQGACTYCGRRFFVTGRSREGALIQLRLRFRNHTDLKHQPCIAAVKSYARGTTEAKRASDRERYQQSKRDNAAS
jgi:hypothetical protein